MWPFKKKKTPEQLTKQIDKEIKDLIIMAQDDAIGVKKEPQGFFNKLKAKWNKHADSGKGKFMMVAGGVSALAISIAAIVASGGIAAAPIIFGGVGFACSGTSLAGTLLDKKHDENKFAKDVFLMMRDNFKILDLIQKDSNMNPEQRNHYIQVCTENQLNLEDTLRGHLKKQYGLEDAQTKLTTFEKVTKGTSKTAITCTATMVVSKASALMDTAESILHVAGAVVGGVGTMLGIAGNTMRKVTHHREVEAWRPERNRVATNIHQAMHEVGLKPSQKIAKWAEPTKVVQLTQEKKKTPFVKKAASGGLIAAGATIAADLEVVELVTSGMDIMGDAIASSPDVAALGGVGVAVAAVAAGAKIANRIIEKKATEMEADSSWVDRISTRGRSNAIDRSSGSVMRSIAIIALLLPVHELLNLL